MRPNDKLQVRKWTVFKINQMLRIVSGITRAAVANDNYIFREIERFRSVDHTRSRRGSLFSAACTRFFLYFMTYFTAYTPILRTKFKAYEDVKQYRNRKF